MGAKAAVGADAKAGNAKVAGAVAGLQGERTSNLTMDGMVKPKARTLEGKRRLKRRLKRNSRRTVRRRKLRMNRKLKKIHGSRSRRRR